MKIEEIDFIALHKYLHYMFIDVWLDIPSLINCLDTYFKQYCDFFPDKDFNLSVIHALVDLDLITSRNIAPSDKYRLFSGDVVYQVTELK